MSLPEIRKKIYKFKRKLINFLLPTYYKGFKKFDLIVFDDIYPHPVSGFRLEEINSYLEAFQKIKVIANPISYPIFNTDKSLHQRHLDELLSKKHSFKKKIKTLDVLTNINSRLFYCIFLNNIYSNMDWIEKFKIPFVFTLYPGGGFELNNAKSDSMLKMVLSSKLFQKVIVTQEMTLNYLVEKAFCRRENIEFIFGCVVPQSSIFKKVEDKKYFPIGKNTLDICFCGAKYMIEGKDKGYDLFIKTAHKVAERFDFVRFHVIGGFSEYDLNVSSINNKIKFYGYQEFGNLSAIYKEMDMIVSPNRPFLLSKGAFDGFPLGTVVEAVLNGVVALVSDELKQNSQFENKKEIVIVETTAESIEKEIIYLIENPLAMISISNDGKKKFSDVYSNESQVVPRVAVLETYINKNNKNAST
jgi:glycosyltransferase involved in cell wall biosynthesis